MDLAYQTYDNAHYSALWHSTYFPQSIDSQVSLQSDVLFTGSSSAQLHSNLLFTVEGYLALTTERNVLRGMISNTRNSDQHLKFADFKQVYALYRFGTYDFSAGKMLIDNGVAKMNSITDVLNEINPIGYQEELVVGTWHFRADYYNAHQDQLSLMVFPFEVWDNKLPLRNRFYGHVAGYADLVGQDPDLFTDVSFQSTGYDDSNLPSWSWYGKYTGSHQETDFFGGVYYGHSPYTVAQIVGYENEAVSIIKLRKPKALDMAGISHPIKNAIIYGETLLQWTPHNADDHFLQVLGGIQLSDTHYAPRLHLEELSYTLEMGFDQRLKKQEDASYYFSSVNTRHNIQAISGQIDLKKDERHAGFVGLSINYKDKGLNYFIGSTYRHNKHLRGQLSLNGYGGPDDSTMGRWKNNHNLQLSLNYDF
jgi:hypothetical protein